MMEEKILETERLILRKLTDADAPFIMELVNDPDWLRYIGDRDVHSLEDARRYIRQGPLASYERNGFGLWLVERKEDHAAVGMCGLLRRDTLPDVDMGFAFLPEFRGKGYGYEAASAVISHGMNVLKLPRILAIVVADNAGSIRVLEKLGMKFERKIPPSGKDPELLVYA